MLFHSIRRLVLVALLFLLSVQSITNAQPKATQKAKDDRVQVCPLYCYGQWGNVYYYYGCVAQGEFAGAFSNRLHVLGQPCGEGYCADPIKLAKLQIETSISSEDFILTDEIVPLLDFVPFKTSPGLSNDRRGIFYTSSPSVKIQDDIIVKLSESGRYFRIISVLIDSERIKNKAWFGQECKKPTDDSIMVIEGKVVGVSSSSKNVGVMKFSVEDIEVSASVVAVESFPDM